MDSSYKLCNKLFHGCGIAGMRLLDDGSIPLVITSPPYGSIRDYGGHSFYFKPMARELWRVVMQGGVVCWHMHDQITDGSESGESFRQAVYFLNLGFNLNTTLLIEGSQISKYPYRYGLPVQYAFVLSKGKPRSFNPIKDVPNKGAGELQAYKNRLANGRRCFRKTVRCKPFRKRSVHWRYSVGTHNTQDIDAREHPALMPEALAKDLILSWSNEGDLVLDPMSGAGTTAKMAFLSNRRYLGFEINREYHDLAVGRMDRVVEKSAY
ncbi:DNA-methyltransferase [Gimesia maris]|uniref:DNA-methyltransferase n=1 Tax=Gimesia maris TaxID=122 RepID=UPI0032EDC7B2